MSTDVLLHNGQIDSLVTPKIQMANYALLYQGITTMPEYYGKKIKLVQTEIELLEAELQSYGITKGSLIYHQALALRKINVYNDLFITVLEDVVSSVAAEATITLSGTSTLTVPKSYRFKLHTSKEYSVQVDIPEVVDTLAAKIVSAINNDDYALCTATYATPVVTLTAKNKGSHMNGQCFDFSKLTIPGIEIDVTPFAGGALDPSVASILSEEYTNEKVHICAPFYAMKEVNAHLTSQGTRPYTNTLYTGIGVCDVVLSYPDVATFNTDNELPKKRNVAIVASVTKTLPNIDGRYFQCTTQDSSISAVEHFARLALKIQEGAILNRGATTNYSAVGGFSQLSRDDAGTPLDNKDLHPYVKETMLSPVQRKALEREGLSYQFPNETMDGLYSSKVFLGTNESIDTVDRTMAQWFVKDFIRGEIHAEIQDMAKNSQTLIGVSNGGSLPAMSEITLKAAIMDRLTTANEKYQFLGNQQNFEVAIAHFSKTFKAVGVPSIAGLLVAASMPIFGHVEDISTQTIFATYNQINQ